MADFVLWTLSSNTVPQITGPVCSLQSRTDPNFLTFGSSAQRTLSRNAPPLGVQPN